MSKSFTVTVFWDEEAHVWVATSEDIVGLVTESASLDELYARVVAVTPELLEDNATSVVYPELVFTVLPAPGQIAFPC